MDRTTLDQYEQGVEKLRQAVAGLSERELRAAPVPGKWSTQQVVIHLADAEAAFADRIKRLIAEDNPTLLAWSENQFAARLHYEDQSVADALLFMEAARRNLSRVLRKLPDADFERAGTHSQRGRQTLAEVIGMTVWHLDHHLKFIHEKRKALGK